MDAPLLRLAEQFETPFYAYDLAEVKRRTQELRESLPEGARLLHSFKANPLPSIAEKIRLEGGTAEITSEGELQAARLAGHDMREALYGGPGKTVSEITSAMAAGVRWFSCESWRDLERISAVASLRAADAQILLRVNPAEAPQARLAMTGVESQFGFDESLLLAAGAREKLQLPHVKIRGIHVYFGTQVASVEALTQNTQRAIETAERLEKALGFVCSVVNAGGGFPWPYANQGSPPDLQGLRGALTAVWEASPLHETAELWFEAGRYLCASAGTLVSRVLDVKPSRSRTFVVLDTGIHHLGGMAGLGRIPRSSVTFQNLSRQSENEVTADIVGPLCTPLDSLARGLKMPDVAAGDLLAVPNVGAYGLTASLIGFLSHPAPAEIAYLDGEVVQVWQWRTGHQQLQS
ncbi:type III PLP-dependent enzyme domain-containing protein [Prosthecobacter dejongeii]|uniref:Diaminopimelate decarboxylase n=1 Tax=Prosthecobacter dejongeii TaxID=48465 RepID=A0A7W8DRQ9_9BACT|nr:type III PLP-dependent enzyme [Prosthecobacter dejongeii]MBB5039560.1 diaminopimelate decarboxylase [Prosthecobacter dejongeii]